MNIEFLATVAVIAPDPMASRSPYVEAPGLPLQGEGDGYYHSEQIAGCRSFGIWPLSQAAQACFGTDRWPADRPVPQVSIEFDVPSADAVAPAARQLVEAGHDLLHEVREEPCGQTVAGFSHPRARSSASPTRRCSTTERQRAVSFDHVLIFSCKLQGWRVSL